VVSICSMIILLSFYAGSLFALRTVVGASVTTALIYRPSASISHPHPGALADRSSVHNGSPSP
jgi:hypothetical protein